MLNTYKVVMYVQRSHRFCNIHTPDDGLRSSRNTRNYSLTYSMFNQLTVCKQMSSGLFKNITYKLRVYKSYIICI